MGILLTLRRRVLDYKSSHGTFPTELIVTPEEHHAFAEVCMELGSRERVLPKLPHDQPPDPPDMRCDLTFHGIPLRIRRP